MAPAPLSIYVHVPFCEQKCAYCDFFTITDPGREHPLYNRWLDLCLREAELWRHAGDIRPEHEIATVFFGGGTPSLLPPGQFARFMRRLRERFAIAQDAEVTLETQPGTVTAQSLREFAEAGINRFSIGVQTFNERLLERTGRRHTVNEARDVVRGAKETGQLVSLDLIAALPGQTLDQWKGELAEGMSLEPDHISVYELTFHAGTEFHRELKKGTLRAADEEQRVAMFNHTRETLTAAGFEHYEISNYAKPGARSKHNQTYWKLGDYIGLGAGAHSFVYPHRYTNANAAADYARAIDGGRLFRRLSDTTDPVTFMLENLHMALRLVEGVDLREFGARFGSDLLEARRPRLEQLEREGLVELQGRRLRLTRPGQLQADSVTEFLI